MGELRSGLHGGLHEPGDPEYTDRCTQFNAMPGLWATGAFSALSRRGAERLGFVPVRRFRLVVLDAGPHQPNRFDLRREPR